MTCDTCAIHKGEFSTEKEYKNFLKTLSSLIDANLIKKLGCNKDSSPFDLCEYQCIKCHTNWILSVPDHAFRGGWNEKKY